MRIKVLGEDCSAAGGEGRVLLELGLVRRQLGCAHGLLARCVRCGDPVLLAGVCKGGCLAYRAEPGRFKLCYGKQKKTMKAGCSKKSCFTLVEVSAALQHN